MKRKIFLVVAFVVALAGFGNQVKAQTWFMDSKEKPLDLYQFKKVQAQAKEADIELRCPKGFSEAPIVPHIFNVNPYFQRQGETLSTMYGMYCNAVVQSDDKQAMVMYHPIYGRQSRNDITIEEDILMAMEDDYMDVTKSVKIVDPTPENPIANADKVAFYKFRTKNPFYGLYQYFYCIYFRKLEHPALLLRVAMTKEGAENMDKYVEAVLKSVNYGNEPVQQTVFKMEGEDVILDSELKFPTKKIKRDTKGLICRPLVDKEAIKQRVKLAEEGKYDPFTDKTLHVTPY